MDLSVFFVGFKDPRDPMVPENTDAMVSGTATPDMGENKVENCVIWELVNGSTGQEDNTASFDSEMNDFKFSRHGQNK